MEESIKKNLIWNHQYIFNFLFMFSFNRKKEIRNAKKNVIKIGEGKGGNYTETKIISWGVQSSLVVSVLLYVLVKIFIWVLHPYKSISPNQYGSSTHWSTHGKSPNQLQAETLSLPLTWCKLGPNTQNWDIWW